MRYRKGRIVTDPDLLPLYGNRRIWMETLMVSYGTMVAATMSGELEGDLVGLEHYYTRKQILKWYAPSLYKEMYEEGLV